MPSGSSVVTDWAAYRRLYPITARLAYLNSAAMGPLPTPVRAAIDAHLDRWQGEHLGASITVDSSEPLRAKAARLIGATAGEICFTGGVTDGMFRAASLVRPQRGETIVVPSNEFPTGVYPWRRFEAEGVRIRFAGPETGRIHEGHLMEACDASTRAVCASLVSFADGTTLDLGSLGEFCRPRGIALIVDAMQAAGAIAIDVGRTPVDFLAFGPVKWIPAPVGAGILYVRGGWEQRAEGRWLGWRSVRRDGLRELLRYDLDPWEGARRLDGGSPAFLSHVGLEAALDLLLGVGAERIDARVRALSRKIHDLLVAEGLPDVWPSEEERRAGIVVCGIPAVGVAAGSLVEGLAADGVIVAERNGRLRVSAHAFNDERDLERLHASLRARRNRA